MGLTYSRVQAIRLDSSQNLYPVRLDTHASAKTVGLIAHQTYLSFGVDSQSCAKVLSLEACRTVSNWARHVVTPKSIGPGSKLNPRILGIDIRLTHMSMIYHPANGPSKQGHKLKIHFLLSAINIDTFIPKFLFI